MQNRCAYTIKAGDTLSAIAQRKLGNAHRWREITKENGRSFTEEEARRLAVGQVVYLPQLNQDVSDFTGCVAYDFLKIRSAPTATANLVGSYKQGDIVHFDAWTNGTSYQTQNGRTDNLWYRIQGTNNWVAGAYIDGHPKNNTPFIPISGVLISGLTTCNQNLSANMRAFLDTIAYAEGTQRPDGYNITYAYQRFESYTDHPRIPVTANGITSTAAGRYQFLNKTWDEVKQTLGLKDFSPANQDIAAVQLIKRRGAYDDVENGRISDAIAKCRNEWASLPGNNYGQPQRSMQNLLQVYQKSLSQYV